MIDLNGMRRYDANRGALVRDAQIRQHPHWAPLAEYVADWIAALRAWRHPADLCQLHRSLFDTASNWQAQLEDDERQLASLQAKVSGRRSVETRELQIAIEFEIDVLKASISVLRTMADGLVWQVAKFDRAKLGCLGEGRMTRRLAPLEGRRAELARMEEWEAKGAVVVHADLATTIRFGDLLVASDLTSGDFHIEEVKRGEGGRDRRRRQHARIDELNQLLATGHRPPGTDSPELVLRYGPVPTRTHRDELTSLISRAAREGGYARTVLEDGLLAEALWIDEIRTGFSLADANAEFMAEQDVRHATALVAASTHRRLRDRKSTFSTQLPLSLMPFGPQTTAALLTGALDLVITCDTAQLARRLERKGIVAKIFGGEASASKFLEAASSHHRLTVPAPARDQVMIEGLTLDCLVERVAWMFQHMPEPGQNRFSAVGFYDEASAFLPAEASP